ncbi:hypothetical protein ACFXHA_28050 [Nocardia sp. NPDC059240]|uniref:hypothetical protein n=1 Tax=Nocardia sp. NPDC059240 TaxID=3346786 RepID=UPI003685EF32
MVTVVGFVVVVMTMAWWHDVDNDGFAAHPTQFAFCVVGWIVAAVAIAIDLRPARSTPWQPDGASRSDSEEHLRDRELADFRADLVTVAVLIAPDRPRLSTTVRFVVEWTEDHRKARTALLEVLLGPSDGRRTLADLDLEGVDSEQYDELIPSLLRAVARYGGRAELVPFLIVDEDRHRGYLGFVTRTRTTTLVRLAEKTGILLYAADVTR